jgi:CheY-like chemotaxis protein
MGVSGARPRLVLIVEDDKAIADLLASAINDERGYEAFSVESADEALSALGRTVPDLVVLDIRLPGVSGLALYDRIRGDPRFQSIPVVFETGEGREYAQALRDRGIATYIRKPFDLEELVRFLKRLVPSGGHAKPAA